MSDPVSCPKCSQPIPTGSPGGICPACLIQAGLGSSWVDVGTRTHQSPAGSGGGFIPPAIELLSPLFPQLELMRVLGHGGMGAVYLARQKSLDRLVALKIIRPESAGVQGFAERFSREARALARLNHPGIVGVHDFGSVSIPASGDSAESDRVENPNTASLFFLLMEYIDGANVRQLIATKSLKPAEALAIVPQICEALQFAHDMGIVHRDIKPENILLDQRGRVKIADFGLAKMTAADSTDHSLTGTHQIMGTPRYMAPEQLDQSRTIDHRADIYSLGVVFYEMLTGEIPMGMFDPPSRKVQVDVRLDKVVLRSLAREPERRYQQASEIKTDVDLVVGSSVALQNDNPAPIASIEKQLLPQNPNAGSRLLRMQLASCVIGTLATLVPYFYYSSCFWGISTSVSWDHGPIELREIAYDSPAWKSGFRPGDRIVDPPDYHSAEGTLNLVETGQGRQSFKVERGDQQVSLWAEPVSRQFARIDYLSPWYPVAGFLFLALGFSIFIFDSSNSKLLWPSLFVLTGGIVLATGCLIALFNHSIFTRVVLWQSPAVVLNDGFRALHFGQPYLAVLASLVLTAFGAVRLRTQYRQCEINPAAANADLTTLVGRPATALTIVAWLAIPALLITAILLAIFPAVTDAAGY